MSQAVGKWTKKGKFKVCQKETPASGDGNSSAQEQLRAEDVDVSSLGKYQSVRPRGGIWEQLPHALVSYCGKDYETSVVCSEKRRLRGN